jgi:hypothetical protein
MHSISRIASAIVALFAAGAANAASWPSVSTELPPTGLGENDAAVVVGISEYAFLPKVAGAAENATDWFRYLVKTRGVPQEHVHLLRDIDATAESMLEAIDQAATEAKPGGTVWFLFVGHGAPTADHDDGLVLGADTQVSEKSLLARGVPQKELLARIEKGQQAHAIVVFDACFSGTIGDGKTQLVPGSQATIPVRRINVAAGRSSILSASDQVAGPLPGHDRPAFSYLLLGAARGWADEDKNATVTLGEAFEYTRDVLRTMVRGRSQVPSLRGAKDGVVVAERATEAGPDLVDLQAALAPSGDIFRSSALSVPTIDVGTFGNMALREMNIAAERALENALDAQESSSSSPVQKRDAWCALAGIGEKNPYLEQAKAACVQWGQYIDDEARLEANMTSDYTVLVDYVGLRRRTNEMKIAAVDSFLSAYGKYASRQEVLAARMARENLAANRPAGIAVDTDGDGLLIDGCPAEAEDEDGDVDDDGCPEVNAAEAAGKAVGGLAQGAEEFTKSIGFHLYLLDFNSFNLDTGIAGNFGLWDQTGVPTKWDLFAFRPTASIVNRVTWGPLEAGAHLNWDLARDFDDGGMSVDVHGGARVFALHGWTPSVGVDLRNVGDFAVGRRGGPGAYFANEIGLVGGLRSRLTYRYGLEAPGAIVPIHSVQLELVIALATPRGSPFFDALDDAGLCD